MNDDNDYRQSGEQQYPYNSYYDGVSYTYEDPNQHKAKRKGSKSAAFILLVLLVLLVASAVVFTRHYNIDINKDDGSWSLYVGPKIEQLPDGENPLPQTSVPASQPDSAMPSYAPTGDGTVLPMTTLAANRQVLTLREIYAKVEPSVVGVLCQSAYSSGSGTGIIMSDNGYIITNCHVISDAEIITVELSAGDTYPAALVGCDESSDLAVIKINAENLPVAEFGSSDSLQVGDEVSAIGNPLGLELKGTLTDGIISAINRDIEVNGRTMALIQTNAALNAGNSGGPLINGYGQVVGVNTMKISSYYSSVEGLGFAIPISLAKPIVDELIEKGYVSGRPALGITGRDISVKASAYYQLPGGVLVNSVEPGSDAVGKLEPGDVIVKADGVEVQSMDELNEVKNNFVAGEAISLTVYRNGQLYEVEVTLIDAATVD